MPKGIHYPGNMCYLNAALLALLNIDEVRSDQRILDTISGKSKIYKRMPTRRALYRFAKGYCEANGWLNLDRKFMTYVNSS